MSTEKIANYGAEQIKVLEGLEAVRKRPGMYIGTTSARGLHHLVWEIVDNSIDEHLAGFGNEVNVQIHNDNSISVTDHGRGIPTAMHEKGVSAAEVILTILHAGGKFGGEGSGYKTSGGLHGVGSSVVNALSNHMIATIKRDGKVHQIEFSQGNTIKPLEVIGTCPEEETGTTIWFKPDPEIFKETTEFDYKTIYTRMRESAFLNPELKITVEDQREVDEETGEFLKSEFLFDGGIRDFVTYINRTKKALHDDVFYVREEQDGIQAEVSLQYCEDSYSKDGIFSYANNIRTPEGGTHESGFKSALTQTVKDYIQTHELMKKGEELPNGEDMRVGITAIVSVRVPECEFEGQTKSKLGNSEVRPVVENISTRALTRFFEENPESATKIVSKIIDSFEERMAARKARENRRNRKAEERFSIQKSKKLADCRSTDPKERELFLVEGDSAGGSAKQGRDSHFQAILPLRGKVINVEKAKEEKIYANNEIREIIRTIKTGIGEDFNIDNASYHKVIFMTDADVDGSHIQILLLTLIYRYMRPLIEHGLIYLARPPLYKITHGKTIEYAYTDAQKDAYVSSLAPSTKYDIQRYKGLGEMNPEQLWETTMDPATRSLYQVTIEDAADAEILFSMLMGDDSQLRKEFIHENSHKAINIDI